MGDKRNTAPRCMSRLLYLAAFYNIVWGMFTALFPNAQFHWIGIPASNYPSLWQCVGMIVGVYGVGYAIAATDPYRHWPIVFVGLLGKLLGPIGLVISALRGELPWRFGYISVTNDLIWWVPFALILYHAYRSNRLDVRKRSNETDR